MAKYLKQSTAAHIMFGPFVDKGDGVTLEVAAGIVTSIDHASTGIFLSKSGAAGAIRHANVTASVLDAYGMFQVHLDTTDTDTVGNLRVMMAEAATFLPVWDDYVVLPANVYDALMGTDLLDISIVQVNGAAQTATLDTIKAETVLIVEDTGTTLPATLTTIDGIVDDILVDTGTTLDTLIKDIPTNAELATALGTADDAVLAALTAIKGAGWTTETLATIGGAINGGFDGESITGLGTILSDLTNGGRLDLLIDAIKAKSDLIPASPAAIGSAMTLTAAYDKAKDDVLTPLAVVDGIVDAILVDTGTTLDTLIKDIPTNAELATALGTADDAVLAALVAAKAVIDNIHDTDLPAVKAETALIVEDTGTTLPATLATLSGYTDSIAGDVWSHAIRTLTNQGIESTTPAAGDPLVIYRDTTVVVSLTGLGDSTGAAGTKIFFTAKENLEDADTSSIIQAVCTRATPITDPDTDDLLYINKTAPTAATEGSFVFADHADGTAVLTIAAVAAADLPIYAATPLYVDVKMVTSAGVVTRLAEYTMYIYGTSTRAIT